MIGRWACHLNFLKTYYVITKLTSSYNINAINREFQDNISIQFSTNPGKMLLALILSQYMVIRYRNKAQHNTNNLEKSWTTWKSNLPLRLVSCSSGLLIFLSLSLLELAILQSAITCVTKVYNILFYVKLSRICRLQYTIGRNCNFVWWEQKVWK